MAKTQFEIIVTGGAGGGGGGAGGGSGGSGGGGGAGGGGGSGGSGGTAGGTSGGSGGGNQGGGPPVPPVTSDDDADTPGADPSDYGQHSRMRRRASQSRTQGLAQNLAQRSAQMQRIPGLRMLGRGVGVGARAAGAAGAAGLGGAAGAAAAVAAPLAILAGALVVAGAAAKKFASAMRKQVKMLQGFSPEVAFEASRADVRRQFALMRRADAIGEGVATFAGDDSLINTAFMDLQTQLLKIGTEIYLELAPLVALFYWFIEWLTDVIAQIWDAVKRIVKWMGDLIPFGEGKSLGEWWEEQKEAARAYLEGEKKKGVPDGLFFEAFFGPGFSVGDSARDAMGAGFGKRRKRRGPKAPAKPATATVIGPP